MTDIEELARAEALAEQDKAKADTEWRVKWWRVTMALGMAPKFGSGDLVAKVATILGQSRDSVANRRRLGVRVSNLGIGNVETLPPRMTMAIPADRFTIEAVERAREAEANGMSLREFAAEITGVAWSDTPEGTSDERLEQIIDAAGPETIAKVARHPKVQVESVRQRNRHRPVVDPAPEETPAGSLADGLTDLLASNLVDQSLNQLVDFARRGMYDRLDADVRAEAQQVFRRWRDTLEFLLAIVDGQSVTDAAINEWLAG